MYAIDMAMAGILMLIDIRLFWLYVFFNMMYIADRHIDFLRKLIRVYHTFNEIKLMAVAQKVGVPANAYEEIYADEVARWGTQQARNFEKDVADLGFPLKLQTNSGVSPEARAELDGLVDAVLKDTVTSTTPRNAGR